MLDHLHGKHDVEALARIRERSRGGRAVVDAQASPARHAASPPQYWPPTGSAPTTSRPCAPTARSRCRRHNRCRECAALPAHRASFVLRPNWPHAVSLMKASRTGLNLCSIRILPRGSHHSAAMAEKRATSAASTVELGARSAGLVTRRSKTRLRAHEARGYLYLPFRAGARLKHPNSLG